MAEPTPFDPWPQDANPRRCGVEPAADAYAGLHRRYPAPIPRFEDPPPRIGEPLFFGRTLRPGALRADAGAPDAPLSEGISLREERRAATAPAEPADFVAPVAATRAA